jgi:hypothetical protein
MNEKKQPDPFTVRLLGVLREAEIIYSDTTGQGCSFPEMRLKDDKHPFSAGNRETTSFPRSMQRQAAWKNLLPLLSG